MKFKSRLWLEVKNLTEDGTFEGMLSPYNNLDEGGDIVDPGAYAKTLKERGNVVPMLWQHKATEPIGQLTLEDTPLGLFAKGKLLLEDPMAQRAYMHLKAGTVKGLSIGYKTLKDAVEKGVRHLKEIKLYEGSVVTFPMNEMALITSVKAEGDEEFKGDFTQELEEYQVLDAYDQMFYALRSAFSSVTYSDQTKEEKIAMKNTILEQFATAMDAFYPTYIDKLVEVYGIGKGDSWLAKRQEKKGTLTPELSLKIRILAEKVREGNEALIALVELKEAEDPAKGTVTSGQQAAEQKTEPDEDHSAAVNERLENIRKVLASRN